MVRIFTYGTLMRGFGNHPYVQNQKLVGKGLTINKYLMTAEWIPYVSNIEHDQSTHIFGEVYEVDEEALISIDALEGHPRFYKREEIDVRLDNGSVEKCWIYFCPHEGVRVIESGNYYLFRLMLLNEKERKGYG